MFHNNNIFVPLVSPNLAINLLKCRKRRTLFLFILFEASPNAQHEINSPLPRLIEYLPVVGSGYTTNMSVL